MSTAIPSTDIPTPSIRTLRESSVLRQVNVPPRTGINTLLVTTWATIGLIVLGWLPIQVPNPYGWLNTSSTVTHIQITLQVPWALLCACALGPVAGVLPVILLVGLSFIGIPLLANGGGQSYLLEPSMGYWLGLIASAAITGRLYRRIARLPWSAKKLGRLALTLLIAFACFHTTGMLYMGILALSNILPWNAVLHWVTTYTIWPLPYQVSFSVVAMALIPLLRLALYLPLY